MTHIHDLAGCAPAPLAHYLKALGILRLVSENTEHGDPSARGWWEGDRFRLATRLNEAELVAFVLKWYEPTPMFNPWGGRSGFYPDNSEKSARTSLESIEQDTQPRLAAYRAALSVIRAVIQSTCGGNKPEKDEAKDRLIQSLRQTVRGKSALWIDAVCAVVGSGDDVGTEKPALFGTGGNEGSGSYTSAYMAAIEECLIGHKWDHAVSNVLFASNPQTGCEWNHSMGLGQFLPDGIAAPWDLLLAFEGACALRSGVSSRNATDSARWMSSPFYVAPASYGYPSEARLDEYAVNKGKEMPGRGEQWFPLWSQPMLFGELCHVFAEGRAATKRGRANDGWSMVRAIGSLGVRRGIREFARFGYQQRNNLATHFAVPIGRFRVPERVPPQMAGLDDLDTWLPGLRREARGKKAPDRLRQVERHLSDALFSVAQHPNEPSCWQKVLLAMADLESVMVTGSGYLARPVPRLKPVWIQAADDGSPEFRLALSLALQHGGYEGEHAVWWNQIRRHWLPLNKSYPGRFSTSGAGSQARLVVGPEVVMQGRSGVSDAIALVERRLIEAAQRGSRQLPLKAATKAHAHPADLADWLAGRVDPDRTLALARALMALDRHAVLPSPPGRGAGGEGTTHDMPDDAWMVLRLSLLPWPLKDGREIKADPAIYRRLSAGDATGAVELALRRLAAAGIRTAVRVAAVPPETARLWAAALAFPISRNTAEHFIRHLNPNQETSS